MPFGHEGIGGRAGPSVEIFITATHREIGRAPAQIDGQRAARMRQVPQHQCPRLMRGAGQFGHVEQFAGLVMRMGQQQQRDVLIKRLDQPLARGQPALGKPLFFQAIDHVEVGREIARLAEHDLAPGAHPERGGNQLEQVHAGRIAGDNLLRLRPDQRRDPGADPGRPIDPSGRIPAADQVLPPLLAHHLFHPRRCRFRQAAQRVAIEVDHAFGHKEPLAKFGQRIACIEDPRALKPRLSHRAARAGWHG